jgi:hypothetical protein
MSKEDLEYWTTAEGKRLHVDEMDDKHVRNAFKMLLRQINYLKLKEKIVRKSNKAFEVNGEMAREHFDAYEVYEQTGVDILDLDGDECVHDPHSQVNINARNRKNR